MRISYTLLLGLLSLAETAQADLDENMMSSEGPDLVGAIIIGTVGVLLCCAVTCFAQCGSESLFQKLTRSCRGTSADQGDEERRNEQRELLYNQL